MYASVKISSRFAAFYYLRKIFFFFYSFVELGITKDDIRNLKQGFQGEIVKFIFNDEEMGLKAENIAYDKVDEYFDD